MSAPRARRARGENRQRLIQAAIEEFGSRGFAAATTSEIARRADVPQPHVYTNFSDKHALIVASVETAISNIEAGTHGAKETRLILQSLALFADIDQASTITKARGGSGDEIRARIEALRAHIGEARWDMLITTAAETYFAPLGPGTGKS